jgi:hypothetical protein
MKENKKVVRKHKNPQSPKGKEVSKSFASYK